MSVVDHTPCEGLKKENESRGNEDAEREKQFGNEPGAGGPTHGRLGWRTSLVSRRDGVKIGRAKDLLLLLKKNLFKGGFYFLFFVSFRLAG